MLRRRLSPRLRRCIRAVAILGALGVLGTSAADFEAFHRRYAEALQRCTTDGRVDYRALQRDSSELDAYLDAVAALPSADFDAWPRREQLALLLNLYNAATLRLIADHYPVKSIRDIGLLPGAAWRERRVRFGGKKWTLDEIEHDLIRKKYGEPRIHFALVCAADGCPTLRPEPYAGTRLETQLDDQARHFLARTNANRFDPATGTLWLSPIFDWYRADFRGSSNLLEFVRRYLPSDAATALGSNAAPAAVRFSDYDWRLNEKAPASPP